MNPRKVLNEDVEKLTQEIRQGSLSRSNSASTALAGPYDVDQARAALPSLRQNKLSSAIATPLWQRASDCADREYVSGATMSAGMDGWAECLSSFATGLRRRVKVGNLGMPSLVSALSLNTGSQDSLRLETPRVDVAPPD